MALLLRAKAAAVSSLGGSRQRQQPCIQEDAFVHHFLHEDADVRIWAGAMLLVPPHIFNTCVQFAMLQSNCGKKLQCSAWL